MEENNVTVHEMRPLDVVWSRYMMCDGKESWGCYQIQLSKLADGSHVVAVTNHHVSVRTTADPRTHFGYKLQERGIAKLDADTIQKAVCIMLDWTIVEA